MKTTLFLFGFLFLFSLVKAQQPPEGMVISELKTNFYICTTFKPIDGNPFPSNSMYVITDKGAILIDTPWNEYETAPLLDSIWKRHHKKVILCLVTHSHDDRTAGLDILNQKGIPTYSSIQTKILSIDKQNKLAAFCFSCDTTFQIGQETFQTFYPGEGHTKDNLVIWFPEEKILYGGCLVKSIQTNNLGYIADANLLQWPAAIEKVARRFPDAAYIIPGHMDWHSKKALKHTLKLLNKSNQAKN